MYHEPFYSRILLLIHSKLLLSDMCVYSVYMCLLFHCKPSRIVCVLVQPTVFFGHLSVAAVVKKIINILVP